MKNKKVIYVYLFSIFITTNYLNLISSQLSDLEETLRYRTTSGIPIYLSAAQYGIFNIVSFLSDAIVVAAAVGILGYFIKGTKVYLALSFGLLLRILLPVLFVLALFFRGELISLSGVAKLLDFQSSVFLALLIPTTLFFSYLGLNYGRQMDYLDAKDEDLLYFYGISMKVWLLILLAYNPVVRFLSRLTIVEIYTATKKISWLG